MEEIEVPPLAAPSLVCWFTRGDPKLPRRVVDFLNGKNMSEPQPVIRRAFVPTHEFFMKHDPEYAKASRNFYRHMRKLFGINSMTPSEAALLLALAEAISWYLPSLPREVRLHLDALASAVRREAAKDAPADTPPRP